LFVWIAMVAGIPSPSPTPTIRGLGKLVKRGTATTMTPPTPYPTIFSNSQDCWNWRAVCYNDAQNCYNVGTLSPNGKTNSQ
jgi:hypothetical protein